MARISVQQVIGIVLGHGSFVPRDGAPEYGDIDEAYRGTLSRAAEKTGLDKAVITGEGTASGRRVAIICSELDFLGDSIGAAAARRVIRSIEYATAEQLLLLLSPTSGDTRMQGGAVAFALVTSITTAVARHKDSHLSFLVYLCNPATGGVMALQGSADRFIFAEFGAPFGFLGLHVVGLATDNPTPEGAQALEDLLKQDIIDGIIPLEGLYGVVRRTIDVLADGDPNEPIPPPAVVIDGRDTWEAILRTRDVSRPDGGDITDILVDCSVPISGTSNGRRSPLVQARLAQISERPAILVVRDHHDQSPLGMRPMGPGSLRSARRAMRIAESLNIPLVTVIDVPGAELTKDAEESAMTGETARTLTTLMNLKVPTVSLILGQGCGGGTLTMLPSDHVLAMYGAWISPLLPGGASTITYRDTEHTPGMMEEQGTGARTMLKTGIIDEIVTEPEDPAELPRRALSAIKHAFWELEKNPARVGREQHLGHYRRFALGE